MRCYIIWIDSHEDWVIWVRFYTIEMKRKAVKQFSAAKLMWLSRKMRNLKLHNQFVHLCTELSAQKTVQFPIANHKLW